MLIVLGVRFPPLKAEMLRMISDTTRARGGTSRETLGWVFFGGVPKRAAENRVKTHVNQINDMLVETDYRVVNRNGLYMVIETERG